MSDPQLFLLILTLLYLSECLCWARRGAALFRRTRGDRWQLALHSGVLANDRGDLHWLWPLPPLGTGHLLRAPPFALTPEGILAGTTEVLPGQGRPRLSDRFLRWDELRSVEAEHRRLLLNGERFWEGDSPHEPLRWAKLLPQLAALKPAEREARLAEELAAAFDRTALEQRRTEFDEAARPIRGFSSALFGLLFLVAPLAFWGFGLLPTLWPALAALLLLVVFSTRRFLQAHRRLHPEAGDERFRIGIVIALAPFSAVRAVDALGRSALGRFHPLTGAFVLLPRAEAEEFARRVWRDLRFPMQPEFPGGNATALAAARWFRERELAAVERFLNSEGVDLEALVRPPKPTESVNVRYCERCESQFTAQGKSCADCGHRPLLDL
jgi:hypothetical protein